MSLKDQYESVIGLEVHVQLLTESKLFSGDSAAFGGEPNTHVSPITLGHPGTLPRMNRKAIEYAVRLGLVLECDIVRRNYFARKHYFYPDLPKGYQVSQHTTPICENGRVLIRTSEGARAVRLNRIHMEEDAGKSMHDQDPLATQVDYNRAGVPLLEIVTEPDLHNAEEAAAYLTELRKIVRHLGICDGNMEEGSMRCDANISIRPKGVKTLGTKVEVKNMNSIRNVRKAIDFEIGRLVELVSTGGTVVQETRSFDADTDTTFAIRTKEHAEDYRYFAEPDLTPFKISEAFLESVRATIPLMPEALFERYTQELGLPEYDARLISDDKELSTCYEALIRETNAYKAAANWVMGPVKSWCNDKGVGVDQYPLGATQLAGIIRLIEEGKINFSIASSRLVPYMMENGGISALEAAGRLNVVQDSSESSILPLIEEVLASMPDKVIEYRKGKKGLVGLFVGEIIKRSKGKADPKIVNQLLAEKLK
ncbi:Asp-tRNA(Asn)/Glu-tRNA(Gln) amidotransferase subunit GatB [Dinghuibacter silviterrae]|uniref:Aspartyl/glutamyl-tRNA(Asn/Gln) amidotransferase subunit B n=1 Tax=Dinghuibacter silviterrae TaxID=1539049 RepID=A0A4R8DP45_9BACT|nr:Asp-tRNA(Asn)/Glu-tRNA(Gln) amidotransferase subunit GatB [Dinghuibacter silviterrae]TDW99477.1 aspartyl/glutamyl-tRNA(Asn/Gln) amidotransferase subunit B [Dinghuibacter silviterrae]